MSTDSTVRSIRIVILAMGGEGGGVLADWLVNTAENQGFFAQSTSVPGVAQRTGSTIYYVEILPVQRAQAELPVLALMPLPGDVDLVVASELMEAGRAVQRGFVTSDRTVLIASSNRVYAMPEKMAMGDGRVDAVALRDKVQRAAKTSILRDFAALADSSGSVISASLFGAIAASGAIPWDRAAFERAIREGGVGVDASLRAFEAGYDSVRTVASSSSVGTPEPEPALDPRLAAQGTRIRREFAAAVHPVLQAGISRVADYQDRSYADVYLDRLDALQDVEGLYGDGRCEVLREAARYLALWMSYEDIARVADLKIRQGRFDRVRADVKAGTAQLLRIHEYFHPRLEELADTLPAALGGLLMRPNWASALVRRWTQKGRVVRTSSLGGFLLLYAASMLRHVRRRSLRYRTEMAHIDQWMQLVLNHAKSNYALACEIAEMPRLVKGYGDTYARGLRNYLSILAVLPRLHPGDAAQRLRELRECALADESGEELRLQLERYSQGPNAGRDHSMEKAA